MMDILYVDDNIQLLELSKEYLEMEGDMSVDTCPSAIEALETIDLVRYDTIISDFQMHGVDGIEFLRIIRDSGNGVPFILFTGKGREDVAIDALNCGADFYLQKGGDPNSQYCELKNMIRHLVCKRVAELDVYANEATQRAIMRTSRDAILTITGDGIIDYVNESVERFTGCPKGGIVGRPMRQFIHPDDRAIMDMLMMQYHNGCNESGEVELRVLGKSGYVTFSCLATAMREEGMERKILVNGRDITDRIRATERECDLNNIFESLSEGVDNGVAIIQNGTIVHCNGLMQGVAGRPIEDIIGCPFTSFIDPEDVPKAVERYMKRVKGEDLDQEFHVRCLMRGGGRRSFSVNGNMIRYNGRSADMLVFKEKRL